MLDEIVGLADSPLTIEEAIVPIGFSLIASVVTYVIYQLFYGSNHIGAGVHRSFIIGGPAITMIFLVIQTSIPLGMGLLGTLSFIRFRTPIKDPAEVGYLLVLIASSIGAATGNYPAIIFLFTVAIAALGVHQLAQKRSALAGSGHLMLSVDQSSFPALEHKLSVFLRENLRGLRLETMSTLDERVGLHYQYRRRPGFDWTSFTRELNELAGTAKVEVFVG